MIRDAVDEEMAALRAQLGDEDFGRYRFEEARGVFERVALGEEFEEFLTLPAYELL
jgi:malate synthase